ncbi:MAG: hypothetical protein ACC662_05260, partial [Planctomycetota bacterium]
MTALRRPDGVIVLRLTTQGRHREVRSTKPRLLLGTAPEADVREEGVGWAPAEAVLHHRGTEVLLERPVAGTTLRLRVGDEARVGRVRVALVGLLPLPEEALPPPPMVFGDYDEDDVSDAKAETFDLAETPAPTPPPPNKRAPPPGTAPPKAPAAPAVPNRGVVP